MTEYLFLLPVLPLAILAVCENRNIDRSIVCYDSYCSSTCGQISTCASPTSRSSAVCQGQMIVA